MCRRHQRNVCSHVAPRPWVASRHVGAKASLWPCFGGSYEANTGHGGPPAGPPLSVLPALRAWLVPASLLAPRWGPINCCPSVSVCLCLFLVVQFLGGTPVSNHLTGSRRPLYAAASVRALACAPLSVRSLSVTADRTPPSSPPSPLALRSPPKTHCAHECLCLCCFQFPAPLSSDVTWFLHFGGVWNLARLRLRLPSQ